MYKVVTYYQENPMAIVDYRLATRDLWDEHISYTRNAIISILAELSDVDDVVKRLMQNQEDIGELLRPYYADADINEFVKLLKEHIAIAGDYVKAAKSKDNLDTIASKWYDNGNAIVDLLNRLNPINWPKFLISSLWNRHMELTIQEVASRINRVWVDDIEAYDLTHKLINEIAETLAVGVVSQNLESFCKNC